MQASPIKVIALCSCMLGVFFLFKSVSIKTPKYVLHELLSFKVNKSRFFRRYIGQQLDALIGFLFLTVGFVLQVYLEIHGLQEQEGGGAGGPTRGFESWWIVIGCTVIILLCIVFLLAKITRYFGGKIFVEHVRFMVVTHGYPLESDGALVLELGSIMRIERDEEDTLESYCKKVREKMKVGPALPGAGKGRSPGLR